MKVYIVRHALTNAFTYYNNGDWYSTKEAAEDKANKMRFEKIKELKTSIKRLENMEI